ncbi:MAG TPA: response regulator, partial [Anaerolineae bacterium]
ALHHLFEVSVLDKGPGHALEKWLEKVVVSSESLSPGQRLHQLLMNTIDTMKPLEAPDVNLPRHRSYLILKRRYVDGVPISQLEELFNCSSRQFRREHYRALEELTLILWNLSPVASLSAIESARRVQPDIRVDPIAGFDRSVSANNLLELVVDAAQTLSGIISATHTQLTADVSADLPPIAADRVALRLALIKMLRVAIAHSPTHILMLRAELHDQMMLLTLSGIDGLSTQDAVFVEAAQLFQLAEGSLSLEPCSAPQDQSQSNADLCLVAQLSTHRQAVVLVIDDDPSMPRIIQRFLALKPVQVVSCSSTDNVLKLAREAQPILILLDVLMPKRDGWEVLQELKANPDTYHIKLAVCSIWDERELAESLGADLFFQKPIGRTELLACVEPYVEPQVF